MNKSILVMSLFLLVGCEEIKTVEFYKTNSAERNKMLDECDKSAEKTIEVNCKNALKAHAELNVEKLLSPIK